MPQTEARCTPDAAGPQAGHDAAQRSRLAQAAAAGDPDGLISHGGAL
jgi:hypothetical protein